MANMFLARRQFVWGAAVVAAAFSCGLKAQPVSGTATRRLRGDLESLGVRVAVILRRGDTVLSHGPVAEPIAVASIRKSLLSALLGMAVAERKLALDATLERLAIEDITPLTAAERSATVADLMTARSGIYLPSEGASGAPERLPQRGSHAPGTHWFYNNWDFNVLGEIYQRATGEGLFTAVEHRLARPLGWQDFDPLRHARWSYDLRRSRFPAYRFQLSTRDLARFGQLYLERGRRGGRQLIAPSWIDESVTPHARPGGRLFDGYGYMWPVVTEENAHRTGLPVGTYSAIGAGGRYVTVVPARQIVLALQPHEPVGGRPAPVADDRVYLPLLKQVLSLFS